MCSQTETRLRYLLERAVVFFRFSIPRALTAAHQPSQRACVDLTRLRNFELRVGIGCMRLVRRFLRSSAAFKVCKFQHG